MPTPPTHENLRDIAAPLLLQWLIVAAEKRSTVNYGEVKLLLETDHDFDRIFPTSMGVPAGALMNAIMKIKNDAPLINVLLVRQSDGMPGSGAGSFMARHFGEASLGQEGARQNVEIWRDYFERAAEEVYEFPNWRELYARVYPNTPWQENVDPSTGSDATPRERDDLTLGAGGEGENHRRLRLWVRDNPEFLSDRAGSIRSSTEVDLLSGDRVDVIYYNGSETIAIEVKSRDSSWVDFRRGVYQCVKYRAVLKAMDARQKAPVDVVLVTETEIPGFISDLCKRFGITHVNVGLIQ